MSFADRLIQAREERGLSQSELARRLGIKPQSVQQWEKKGGTMPRNKRISELALILGKSREWLLLGIDANVRHVSKPMRDVPLLNYIQAGAWGEVGPDIPSAQHVSCPVPCSDKTFALEVIGESMLDEYRPGDVIFVDPEVRPESGDDVVAVLEDSDEATFKRFVGEPGNMKLKALNPDWHPRYVELSGVCLIVGTVIYSGRDPRKRK